jgi:hypothetical protein
VQASEVDDDCDGGQTGGTAVQKKNMTNQSDSNHSTVKKDDFSEFNESEDD